MSSPRSSSGSGMIIFFLAIAVLVFVLAGKKDHAVHVRLGWLQPITRSILIRLRDLPRSVDERIAITDEQTFKRLRQKDYLNRCARAAQSVEEANVERRAWTAIEREAQRRKVSLERCPALLKAAKGFLSSGASWAEVQTESLDDLAFAVETMTAPTRASFDDPSGDYLPGEDVQSHLLKVQEWLDEIVSEYRSRRISMTHVFRKLDSGTGCYGAPEAE